MMRFVLGDVFCMVYWFWLDIGYLVVFYKCLSGFYDGSVHWLIDLYGCVISDVFIIVIVN